MKINFSAQPTTAFGRF